MMEKLMDALRREPVRVRLYAVVVLVAGYLLAKGYLAAADVEFIVGVAALVLAVERARAHAVPVVKATRKARR